MKKILLSLALISGLASTAQITIDNTDLHWTIGNQWYMTKHSVATSSLDVTAGTGKTWDLSSYSSNVQVDTVKVTAGTTEDLDVSSVILKQNTFNAVGIDYHQKMAGGVNLDNAVSIGLPRMFGTTPWVNAASVGSGLFLTGTITGSVVAEGTVKLAIGDFPAILVKEHFVGTGIMSVDITNYFWETEIYGRVAAHSNGTTLLVMEQNNFNPVTSVKQIKQNSLSVYPNPATDLVSLNVEEGVQTIEIYNLLGTKIASQIVNSKIVTLNIADFAKGQYFVKAISKNKVYTTTLLKK